MKNEDVHIGSVYEARVTRQTVAIKILGRHPIKGWIGLNINTNRRIWVKSGRRLIRLLHDGRGGLSPRPPQGRR